MSKTFLSQEFILRVHSFHSLLSFCFFLHWDTTLNDVPIWSVLELCLLAITFHLIPLNTGMYRKWGLDGGAETVITMLAVEMSFKLPMTNNPIIVSALLKARMSVSHRWGPSSWPWPSGNWAPFTVLRLSWNPVLLAFGWGKAAEQ